jgi:hypothetical protein
VGHNRKATFGTISRENAHPFCEKNIVLVHNGTVQDHKTMANVEVDSHAICHRIGEVGAQAALKELKGAYALVWYDITTKKLHLARNNERPLVFVNTEDYFAFASEGYMLGWLLRRHEFPVPKMEVLPENQLFSFSWNPYTMTSEEIEKKQVFLPVVKDFGKNEDVSEWQRYNAAYPRGSSVIFCPHVTVEDTLRKGKFKMKGVAYLPGKPLFQNAIAILSDDYDEADAMDMNNSEKLVAKIRNVILTESGQLCVYLDTIESDVELELWNNVSIPRREWEYFVDHFVCDTCAQPIKKDDNQLTMIVKEKDGYKVICADCVLKDCPEVVDLTSHA